jgi:NAD(P)H-nitrite reductase large subunit
MNNWDPKEQAGYGQILTHCKTQKSYDKQMIKEQQVIDGLKPICLCKGIKKSVFLNHIKAGRETVEELKNATGAGRGSCKGKRCTLRISELLESKK